MEMNREIIPERRDPWVEANIVALKVSVGPGCGTEEVLS